MNYELLRKKNVLKQLRSVMNRIASCVCLNGQWGQQIYRSLDTILCQYTLLPAAPQRLEGMRTRDQAYLTPIMYTTPANLRYKKTAVVSTQHQYLHNTDRHYHSTTCTSWWVPLYWIQQHSFLTQLLTSSQMWQAKFSPCFIKLPGKKVWREVVKEVRLSLATTSR
jgi:hypothetical protein